MSDMDDTTADAASEDSTGSVPVATPNSADAGDAHAGDDRIRVQLPEFSEVRDNGRIADDTAMSRFFNVDVTVSAELGRVTVPIGELLQLGEGSVLEMHRPVSGPIDLMAQGVRIARGEVVVVDDCFAVRIKSIEPPSRRSA